MVWTSGCISRRSCHRKTKPSSYIFSFTIPHSQTMLSNNHHFAAQVCRLSKGKYLSQFRYIAQSTGYKRGSRPLHTHIYTCRHTQRGSLPYLWLITSTLPYCSIHSWPTMMLWTQQVGFVQVYASLHLQRERESEHVTADNRSPTTST
jgi:hypothetical protein